MTTQLVAWRKPNTDDLKTLMFSQRVEATEVGEFQGETLVLYRTWSEGGEEVWGWVVPGFRWGGVADTRRDAEAAAISFVYLN